MRVLVACEYSGRVREAFRSKGHEVYSCDLTPSEDGSQHHIIGDVSLLLQASWDLVIGFPPCTDTSWANGALIHTKRADGRAQKAVDFAKLLAGSGTKNAIEHPSRSDLWYWRRPDQIVQPYEFGDPYYKTTGLWLRGLPPLQPKFTEPPAKVLKWISTGSHEKHVRGVTRNPRDRSRTFQGIAEAMAEQWG